MGRTRLAVLDVLPALFALYCGRTRDESAVGGTSSPPMSPPRRKKRLQPLKNPIHTQTQKLCAGILVAFALFLILWFKYLSLRRKSHRIHDDHDTRFWYLNCLVQKPKWCIFHHQVAKHLEALRKLDLSYGDISAGGGNKWPIICKLSVAQYSPRATIYYDCMNEETKNLVDQIGTLRFAMDLHFLFLVFRYLYHSHRRS